MKIENKIIELDGVKIPYIINEEGIEYYPAKYIFEKFLLKAKTQIHKNKKYSIHMNRYIIDFTFTGTSPQECYCINKNGLIECTRATKLSKLSDLQIKRHDILCDYIESQFKFVNRSQYDNYDEYILDCISGFKENNKDTIDNSCIKCKRAFPLHINFYPKDDRNGNGHSNICKMCTQNCYPINHTDRYARKVYSHFGLKGYIDYKYNRIKFISEYCNDNFTIKFDATKGNNQDLFDIIEYEYNNNKISKDELCVDYVKSNYYVKNAGCLSNTYLIERLSKGDCKVRPWLYEHYTPPNPTYEEANIIVKTYIDENITIDNIFKYEGYGEILRLCKISKFCSNTLYFIVQYYGFKYAGYKFGIKSVNYYKDKDMRIFDMKYFIQEDLNILVSKIPLYVTKYSLHQNSSPLYHILNKYYNNLFEWIDECYPGEFIINDFVNNPFRSEFDSIEEAQIDEQLRLYFKGTIYNCRTKDDYIMIDGMIPDWVIPTNKGCYLVEYFGMYSTGNIESSSRLKNYKTKTDIKIEKYIALEKVGYKHLFIFREDIKNNFEGLKNKLNNIK